MATVPTDLSNWRDPEHSQWSFRNINKIFNTAPIKKGDKTSELSSSTRQFDGFKLQPPNKPEVDLSSFLQQTSTDGLVVLKDGEIVYEYYGRENDQASIHIMMSMTKSITGLVSGILVERGQLDLDATISKYVPEVKSTPYDRITVRQCLDMRAGIQYDDSSPDYRSAAGWCPPDANVKPSNLHEFLSRFQAEPLPEVDGLGSSKFEYVSVSTDLMGWVIENITGRDLADVISELIWRPMGAESDAYITTDNAGNARPAGGMCATLRDIARIGQLVLHDGNGIVPASWIQDMLNNGSREAFAAGSWSGFERLLGRLAYRSYWLSNREDQFLMGLGVHGQMLLVDRRNGIVMAKTSSQASRVDFGKTALTVLAFKEFQRLLTQDANGGLKN